MRKWMIVSVAVALTGVLAAGCRNGEPQESAKDAGQVRTLETPQPAPRPAPRPSPVAEPVRRVAGPHDKPGFVTEVEDGRLWVLRPGEERGEKHITMVGDGPGGMTLKAVEKDTALAYIASKPGWIVSVEDERLWVLRPGQERDEKHVSLIGAGPKGMTLRAVDRETALAYLAEKPGFRVRVEDGRLWVTKPGQSESEKHVTMVGAGPLAATIKALDRETGLEYLAAKPGFRVAIEDGRLWVFRAGEDAGEMPEKHVTRIGAGPTGVTIKAPDAETLNAYLAAPN